MKYPMTVHVEDIDMLEGETLIDIHDGPYDKIGIMDKAGRTATLRMTDHCRIPCRDKAPDIANMIVENVHGEENKFQGNKYLYVLEHDHRSINCIAYYDFHTIITYRYILDKESK